MEQVLLNIIAVIGGSCLFVAIMGSLWKNVNVGPRVEDVEIDGEEPPEVITENGIVQLPDESLENNKDK